MQYYTPMEVPFIERSLEPVVRRALKEFPALILSGPRQAGKTTLLRRLLSSTHDYVSLEPPDVRAAATRDPRGFLDMHPSPVLFDEAQYAPELFPYIKERIDANRSKSGQFVLTGSQNLMLVARVTESLAGRAAILHLLPLSRREISGEHQLPLPWERRKSLAGQSVPSPRKLWKSLLRGGYPEIVANPARDAGLWFSAYVQTYLERDVRALRQVGDLTEYQAFLRALASRSAQVLNLSNLAGDLGVAVNTAKAWLSVMEATHQIAIVRPYYENHGKRMVRRPKVYFTDVGLLCHLVGLKDPAHAAAGPMAGAIFETAVYSEISRALLNRGEEPRIYFWRTAAGSEVDFIVEHETGIVPIEVKLSATPRVEMVRPMEKLRALLGERVHRGWLVHPGDSRLPLGPSAIALPFAEL